MSLCGSRSMYNILIVLCKYKQNKYAPTVSTKFAYTTPTVIFSNTKYNYYYYYYYYCILNTLIQLCKFRKCTIYKYRTVANFIYYHYCSCLFCFSCVSHKITIVIFEVPNHHCSSKLSFFIFR